MNRSSRVMPGLRGMPAGMITSSVPWRALAMPSFSGRKPVTGAAELMCDRSVATPIVFTTSYSESSLTYFDCLSSSDRGWPIPPAAPITVAFMFGFVGKDRGTAPVRGRSPKSRERNDL